MSSSSSDISEQKRDSYGSLESLPRVLDQPKPKERWGSRHTFTLLSFLGFANVYALRVNLSVAIVAMVNSTTTAEQNDACPAGNLEDEVSDGPFNWDEEDQGMILGAFFYGYILTQIPGGILAEKYGGKWLYGMGILVTALLTLLTPPAANWGKGAFIVVRVLEGIGEGVTFPAMHAMISKWIPMKERGRLVAFIYAGSQAGTVISMPASGVLADEVGWESVFYVFGSLGVVWFVVWAFLISDTPDTHPTISEEERAYIKSNIPSENQGRQLPFPPFKHMFTSVPFIALIIAHMGQNWGFYTLLTETPTYLANIQNYSLKANGFLSALPYLCMWISSIIMGLASDWLIKTKKLTVTQTRKVFNSIGQYGPAAGLLWLAFVGCNKTLSIVALCLGVGLNGGVYCGFQINHVDLSPNYAGSMMGITNMLSNICGFVTPYVTGAITKDNQTLEAWRTVFLISVGVYVVFNTIFVIFGQAEIQWWNTYWERQYHKKHKDSIKSED